MLTNYKLLWDDGSTTGTQLVSVSDYGSYDLSLASAGSTYSITVAGVNLHGDGAQSLPISVLLAGKPDKITSFVISEPSSDKLVKLRWTPPADNSSPIDSYEVLLLDRTPSAQGYKKFS